VDTYLGLPVLDLTEPDRADGTVDRHGRRVFELNTQTGARAFDYPGPSDTVVRDFEWVAFSRAEVKAMLDFVDGRRGRAVPFWLRGYERAFNLAFLHILGEYQLTVEAVDYHSQVFPVGPQRRHMAIRLDSGIYIYRRIIAAVDLGAGTEGINFAPEDGLPEPILSAPGLLVFMRYCRLDSDEVRVEWSGGDFARCKLPVREIPREVP
jgi:hypothetical protein